MLDLSLAGFRKKLWGLERRENLFNYESSGVFLWQAFRFVIFIRIAKKLKIIETPHRMKKNESIYSKLLTSLKRLRFFFRDPLFISQPISQKETACILEHSRSVPYEGKNVDIYSHKLSQSFYENNTPFIRLDTGESGYDEKTNCANRFYIDLMSNLVEGLALLLYFWPSKDDKAIFQISQILINDFGDAGNVGILLKKNLIKFKLEKRFYRKIFLRFNINKLYVVVSYGRASSIDAARSLGIEVVELQHGIISPHHPGYGVSSKGLELTYFPDKFYAWSDFWKSVYDELCLPVEVVNHGFPFLYDGIDKYLNMPKDPNKIVVISQGTIGKDLASFIFQNQFALKNYQIKYKLHPGEYAVWKEYSDLLKLNELKNVEVIKACDLYALLSDSKYVIGVYSTAIYEAIELGVKPILVNLSGIEYMEDLLTSGKAVTFEGFMCNVE